MKIWKKLTDWSNDKKPTNVGNRIVIETAQGRFLVTELGDGSVEIAGSEPASHEEHLSTLVIRPRVSNLVQIAFEPRVPGSDD